MLQHQNLKSFRKTRPRRATAAPGHDGADVRVRCCVWRPGCVVTIRETAQHKHNRTEAMPMPMRADPAAATASARSM